jgi:hypothetical protein
VLDVSPTTVVEESTGVVVELSATVDDDPAVLVVDPEVVVVVAAVVVVVVVGGVTATAVHAIPPGLSLGVATKAICTFQYLSSTWGLAEVFQQATPRLYVPSGTTV